MKATEQQKKVIDACIIELYFWRDNNNINSPSNMNELETSIRELRDEDIITEAECEALIDDMIDLYARISNLGKDETPD